MAASATLQELGAEVPPANESAGSYFDMRRQSLAGTSSKLREIVGYLLQAQRNFQSEMQSKSQRQLRLAFPDASAEEVLAVAGTSRSAASSIQGAVLQQVGSEPLQARTALIANEEELDALERLAESAKVLQQAMTTVQILVQTQGETIDNIALHVSKARGSTQAAQDQLLEATRMQARMRKCRLIFYCFLFLLVLVGIGLFFILRRK